MAKNTNPAPIKATVTADEVVTRTLNIVVGKETAVLVITNGRATVARKQGTPLARELAKAVLAAIVPAVEEEVETETAPKATRTAQPEGEREVRRRQPRAEMQAARLRGEIPCLKGKDPFGVDLTTLGIFGTEWEVGMATSQGETAPTPDSNDAPDASTTVTF